MLLEQNVASRFMPYLLQPRFFSSCLDSIGTYLLPMLRLQLLFVFYCEFGGDTFRPILFYF
jgi:hypothetical protein